ncbi:NAD dependent epimerase dehydratase family protein [Grosmannia clavigera kw1407]|uniref:NAD dependent epimerase dehydratase family protein n=1 Tax=Grosmannia clavigera (strain kw1407 / UAMH 11150) TaxID=655863 RepID=F0XE45_GROCL|nr:NAD dependent epimerase dehydratase family protein [Grosmannia clavigera kw1407]EFX04257.1 NAD dependent epimerase dehydratase family protein [Grosmannia clavigera kw1407]
MSSPHVLLLGGHGKIAQLLTPLLLRRSWSVTSIIRNADQVAAVQALGNGAPAAARLTVLVRSLEDVHVQTDAQALLDELRPDYIVWSAGAGGKGAPERTQAIDRDAAVAFVDAAAATPSVTRFLLVSYLLSRRGKASWWDDASWQKGEEVNRSTLARYYEAKLAADEALYRASQRRGSDFVAIDLRPGVLTDGPAGPVELGRTAKALGPTSRATVAAIADLLLAHPHARSAWVDVLDGTEEPTAAVNRVTREGVDAVEGEPVTKN